MNKRAYISYSMNDKDLFILTSMTQILRNYDFVVNTAHSIGFGQSIEDTTRFSINNCSLFLGFVTQHGISSQWTIKEWRQSINLGKPSIFLVEEGIDINSDFFGNSTLIYFNRHNPSSAIQTANEFIRKAKSNQNAKNLVVGGLAILAAIKLLSNE